jgi:predicted amidophosphoribosyltransferase
MKCEGCGKDLPEGAKSCPACGRAVPFGQRAEAETVHVAEKTGEVAGKVGRGIVGGVKGLASGAKKGFKGQDEEKKQ